MRRALKTTVPLLPDSIADDAAVWTRASCSPTVPVDCMLALKFRPCRVAAALRHFSASLNCLAIGDSCFLRCASCSSRSCMRRIRATGVSPIRASSCCACLLSCTFRQPSEVWRRNRGERAVAGRSTGSTPSADAPFRCANGRCTVRSAAAAAATAAVAAAGDDDRRDGIPTASCGTSTAAVTHCSVVHIRSVWLPLAVSTAATASLAPRCCSAGGGPWNTKGPRRPWSLPTITALSTSAHSERLRVSSPGGDALPRRNWTVAGDVDSTSF